MLREKRKKQQIQEHKMADVVDTDKLDDKPLSKDDVLDILNEDDDDKKLDTKDDEDDKEKDEEKEEDKDDEEDKLEIKDDDEELEDLELAVPVRKKEILKVYPDLFKKFPYLEAAYFRHGQYVDIFPTIEDAKEAQEKSNQLGELESNLLSGDTESILKLVKDNDEEAFKKIADNYLPTLAKVDEKAYLNVVSNVVKHTIISMVREGRSLENSARTDDEKNRAKALINHAEAINEFVFGTREFTKPQNLSSEDKKDDSVKKEREEFARERFETHLGELQNDVDRKITSTIDVNIDPKKSMTPFVRKHATKEASEKLEELIGQDKRFKGTLDQLWKAAVESKYSRVSLDKIRSAYLSKAKTLLPSVIKEARNEALKGTSGKKRDDDEEKDHRGHLPVNRTSTSGNKGGKLEIPKGMSSKDFIMSD